MARTDAATPRDEQLWGRRHRIASFVAVTLTLLSMLVTGPLLTLPVTAWFPEPALEAMFGEEGLGNHRVHLEGATLVFWLTIVAMVSQYRRPERHAAPLWAAAVAWVVFLSIELTHLVDPYSIVVTALVLVVLALHPRRWPVEHARWRSGPRLLAIPFAAVAVAYAARQATLQLTAVPGDPHAMGSHYALMTALAVGLATNALLGATDLPGQSISAWTAGLMTLTFAIFSMGHPDQTSSVGVGWGIALLVWAPVYLMSSVRGARVDARARS